MIEKGFQHPINIFPEGATTNNECIIPFKKVAFLGLKSIKPIVFKYEGKISAYNGLMKMFPHYYLMSLHPFITVKIKELPVFKPNEYFWKNHWDEKSGEEKW